MTVESLEKNVVRQRSESKQYCSALEPQGLIDSFLAHPPEGFSAGLVETAAGTVPVFKTAFDLLTTLDDEDSPVAKAAREAQWLKPFCTFPTLFSGTTVSEYALYGEYVDVDRLVDGLLHQCKLTRSQLLIIKDIPSDSPLLSDSANYRGRQLVDVCDGRGALIVEGQALAYVPIDFASIEEYMATKLSYTRRKEIRRKLKAKNQITVETVKTGDMWLQTDEAVDSLYQLYLNVFAQSKYHFDKLSRQFFARVLRDATSDGVVFVYRRATELIGFNLCYVHDNNLIDKYVGFAYPAAKEVNLYFVSWFQNIEFALSQGLSNYIAGWTDPQVKRALGAKFTMTRHAVFVRNPFLRMILRPIKGLFEPDADWAEQQPTK